MLKKSGSKLPNEFHAWLANLSRRLCPAGRNVYRGRGTRLRPVEDLIDEIVVGDGTSDRFILTSSHPNETVADAVAFAKSLTGQYEGEEVQVVEII